MNEDNEKVINELKEKIKTILSIYERTKEENRQLKSEKADYVKQVKEKTVELDELKARYETLKLAKSLAGTAKDTHETKVKINRIVREIDKCIALLNKISYNN